MLLYLLSHSHLDIVYPVNCCARYMFCTKLNHGLAIKRINQYIKLTRDRDLILISSVDKCRIDRYSDTDLSGLYSHKKKTDPPCAKISTSFVITFVDCPVLWVSKLKTERALSTIEAEVIAITHSCRELLLIIDMTKSL